MKHLIYIGGLVLLLAVAGCRSKEENRNSLLWKVSGNGLEKPSYLYGTIHVMCEGEFYFPAKAERALLESEMYVTEMDIKQGFSKGNKLETEEHSNILDLLDTLMIDRISKILGHDWLIVDPSVTPYFLVLRINHTIDYCDDQNKFYEDSLLKLIEGMDIEYNYLETLQDVKPYLGHVTETEGMCLLRYSLDHYEEEKNYDISQDYELYRNEDINALVAVFEEGEGWEKCFKEGREESQEEKDGIVFGRNKMWVPRMEAMMKRKPSFIAVGVAHLPMEEGLIHLLREEGYTVEPVH